MADSYAPRSDHPFGFGHWTVGIAGCDTFCGLLRLAGERHQRAVEQLSGVQR